MIAAFEEYWTCWWPVADGVSLTMVIWNVSHMKTEMLF